MNKAVIIGIIIAIVIGVIVIFGFSENTEIIEDVDANVEDVDNNVEETSTPAPRNLSVELVESVGLKNLP